MFDSKRRSSRGKWQVVTLVLSLLLLLPNTTVVAQPAPGLNGTLIVLNKSGHDASFIDLASGRIVATLPTGRGPHEIIVTGDGRWAVSTDYSGGNSLTVFDVARPAVERTIDLSDYSRPHGILLMPDEETVVVTSEATGKLLLVNFMTGKILSSIETEQDGSHMVALSEDGTRAFTSNMGSDSVSVFDLTGATMLRTLAVPDRPEAITTNKAGDEIWVGSNDEGTVSVIDAETGNVKNQWGGFDWPYRILLSDDERLAVMPDLNKNSLRFFDNESRQEIGRLDFSGARPEGVTYYSDDRTLFLALAGRDEVVAIDVESRTIIGRYQTGSAPDGVAFSPLVLVD